MPDITPAVIAATSTALKNAYATTFHYVFYATIPFGVLLIVACCFIPDMDQYLHNNVAKRLQNMGKMDGAAHVKDAEKV